ncbi:hypothetical protein GCM10018953_11870 [Streptosporangium nondiastaticum]
MSAAPPRARRGARDTAGRHTPAPGTVRTTGRRTRTPEATRTAGRHTPLPGRSAPPDVTPRGGVPGTERADRGLGSPVRQSRKITLHTFKDSKAIRKVACSGGPETDPARLRTRYRPLTCENIAGSSEITKK